MVLSLLVPNQGYQDFNKYFDIFFFFYIFIIFCAPSVQLFGIHLKTHSWHINGSAAAAAAKSLQSCPTLCDPIDSSPPGSPIPGILQARTLELVAISFSNNGSEEVAIL